MRAEAMAKVNLSLRVGARDSSGLHPLFSMAQSIDWRDSVALDESDDDSFAVTGLPGGLSKPFVRWQGRALRRPSPWPSRSRWRPVWEEGAPTPRPHWLSPASATGWRDPALSRLPRRWGPMSPSA
jgi:hypothetical protein